MTGSQQIVGRDGLRWYSLSLRVMSTARTVTEMLSLLERKSFSTAEFNSLLKSPKWADVKPF